MCIRDRVKGLDVYGIGNLREVVNFLQGFTNLTPARINLDETFTEAQQSFDGDFCDVKGQAQVKQMCIRDSQQPTPRHRTSHPTASVYMVLQPVRRTAKVCRHTRGGPLPHLFTLTGPASGP